jgi:hypothetical protein
VSWEEATDGVNRAVASTLGVAATWTPNGSGSPVALSAVFRREHRSFDPESGAHVATTYSSAWIRSADLPRVPIENDRLSIAGLDFLVAAIEPDGQGGMLLVLDRAAA